jgi:hypothetical protein
MLYIDLPISSFIPLDVDNFGQFGILLFFNVLSLKKTPKNYMFVYRCKEDKHFRLHKKQRGNQKLINHTHVHSHMKYKLSLFMMYVMCHILQKDIK